MTFEPVDEPAGASEPSPEPAEDPASPPAPEPEQSVLEAERDPYPLAGPILEEARARVLRGRCSSCEARLRLQLKEGSRPPVRVRCPICGHTGEIDTP